MTILIKKFGDVSMSRPDGKEAYAAFLPTLMGLKDDEEIIIDFSDLNTGAAYHCTLI